MTSRCGLADTAMSIAIKFCGLSRPEDIDAAAAADARYVGFVFYPKSPRAVSMAEARALAQVTPVGLAKVGLVVDPDDAFLDQLMAQVPLDILQLHGHEMPARVLEIRKRTRLPVMKAIGIADQADLAQIADHAAVADQLLIDAKPPKTADLPGGNGLSFDWRLLAGRRWPVPWMLAGGLSPENVRLAVQMTGAKQVDVSSGVERAAGVKDPAMMAAFAQAANPA